MFVLIADDHALVRHGLTGLMRDAHPDWKLAEAASLDETLDNLAVGSADLLLIDLKMPGMDAGTSLAALRDAYPDMRIAVLTGTDDRDVILECLAAGVHGYILKSDAAEQLLSAIDMILGGHVYVPAALTRIVRSAAPPAQPAERRVAEAARAPSPSRPDVSNVQSLANVPSLASVQPPQSVQSIPGQSVTPRQLDVLKLLAEGRSTKDIARQLNLGVGTVKVHLAGVYRALGARNRMEAVVRAGKFKLEP